MPLEPNEPATDATEFVMPELPASYLMDDEVIADNRIGQLLLLHRIVTPEQVDAAVEIQSREPGALLTEVLMHQGLVTQEDIERVLNLQLEELQLGQILTTTGCIGEEQLDEALQEQAETGELLGSTLISLGFCSPEQVGWALAQQKKG
ncbi:MAG TPA: hypothetical protein V6D47_13510 [Oscillatoriaceae cyanobacterium]